MQRNLQYILNIGGVFFPPIAIFIFLILALITLLKSLLKKIFLFIYLLFTKDAGKCQVR